MPTIRRKGRPILFSTDGKEGGTAMSTFPRCRPPAEERKLRKGKKKNKKHTKCCSTEAIRRSGKEKKKKVHPSILLSNTIRKTVFGFQAQGREKIGRKKKNNGRRRPLRPFWEDLFRTQPVKRERRKKKKQCLFVACSQRKKARGRCIRASDFFVGGEKKRNRQKRKNS